MREIFVTTNFHGPSKVAVTYIKLEVTVKPGEFYRRAEEALQAITIPGFVLESCCFENLRPKKGRRGHLVAEFSRRSPRPGAVGPFVRQLRRVFYPVWEVSRAEGRLRSNPKDPSPTPRP